MSSVFIRKRRSLVERLSLSKKWLPPLFRQELHEIFTSISDEIVGKNFMRSVIFEAHVPENDGFSFDSVICG